MELIKIDGDADFLVVVDDVVVVVAVAFVVVAVFAFAAFCFFFFNLVSFKKRNFNER